MERILVATTLVLLAAACARSSDPLPAGELAQYQSCARDDECTVANNAPAGCCNVGPSYTNPVAINRDKAMLFRDAFANASCDGVECAAIAYVGPGLDADWVANRYFTQCASSRCELIVHDHSWDPCSMMMSCASGYECRAFMGSGGGDHSYCWFIETM